MLAVSIYYLGPTGTWIEEKKTRTGVLQHMLTDHNQAEVPLRCHGARNNIALPYSLVGDIVQAI